MPLALTSSSSVCLFLFSMMCETADIEMVREESLFTVMYVCKLFILFIPFLFAIFLDFCPGES